MKPTILNLAVLEDNDEHFKQLQDILLKDQPVGFSITYKIERFIEADEAKTKLFGRSPDILLLDLNVPDSIGFETFEKFKRVSATIIVMSVLEDVELARRCMQAGSFYVVKDWIFTNPLLLHMTLLYYYELSLQREKIKILIKERLGDSRRLIPRCKFCVPRIGESRFKDESTGDWFTFVHYIENMGIQFTDGICPECFEDMRKVVYGSENIEGS
jgi:CheY-like chemotaxis protein